MFLYCQKWYTVYIYNFEIFFLSGIMRLFVPSRTPITSASNLFPLFHNRLYFLREVLNSHQNWAECRVFPYTPAPHPPSASPNSGTLDTTNEPILIHHYHPKLIIYIRVHFWYCTLYVFRQTNSDIFLP